MHSITQNRAGSRSDAPFNSTYRPIESLIPDPRNPRTHSRLQVRKIARSIREFGWITPIVVDQFNNIVCGHGRYEAGKLSGLTEVPVMVVDHLSETQLKAYRIADNRLAEEADWDNALLREIFVELSAVELNFDIELTGFDMGAIDFIIELPQIGATPDKADALPEIKAVPVTRLGDIWQLGRHRVLCGDALDKANYAALLGDERAACVFTDPPYNVKIDGNVGGLGATQHREFVMASGEMSESEFRSFLLDSIHQMLRVSTPGAVMYFCMDWRHGRELHDAMLQAGLTMLNRCTWVKPNGGMGSFYRSRHEDIYVGRNGDTPHRNNVELGRHGRNRTNVWEYPSPASFGRSGEEGRLLDLHPTVKPVALVADAILDCTARGDVVLDPFLGSGSTVIAAEKVGRRCYGMELDPLYVDTVVRRWMAWTGDQAVLASTGQTFAAVTAERQVAHV